MTVTTDDQHHHDDDAHLASLGYTSDFKRDMNLWGNFSLGFTYLSPVVGVYSLFAFALGTGGPPMIWAVVLAAVGQLLVALVFGEVVAQFPVSGGIYPWARRLWGKRWAWMTGWITADACGPMMWQPMICAVFGSARILAKPVVSSIAQP